MNDPQHRTGAGLLQSLSGNLVLVVSQSGNVLSLVEAPADLQELVASGDTSLTIDDLWPAEPAADIRASLKRCIRDRCLCSEDIEPENGCNGHEVILVPQGPDRALLVARDLSEQKLALSRARKLAYVDEVTGLPTRECMFNELQRITDLQRLREGRAAVICIHVGQIDDHGYVLNSAQQDEVLRQLASRLTTDLRGSNDDTITDLERLSIVARADYRHFCIVLPSILSGEDAEAVVSRVVSDLKKPVTVARRTLTVQACGGVALFPQDANDPAGLFENAMAAMQDARNDADSAYKFHSGTIRLRALQRQDLEGELRSALERKAYALNFLPVVDTETGETVLMEALLRWPDSVISTQPIRKIVRVAERTGLIVPIGEWVLRHACLQLQTWRKAGHATVRLAINLSAHEIASDAVSERIAQSLAETATDPRDIDFEIKEHILVREALRDYTATKALAALGARISVDDYGIGACSLAHLSQSPVGAIKIDNTLVTEIAHNERDGAACAAATAMAHHLQIDVIAEGVENEDQAEVLSRHGCRLQQGFLYGRPMSNSEVLEYLDARASRHSEAGVGR